MPRFGVHGGIANCGRVFEILIGVRAILLMVRLGIPGVNYSGLSGELQKFPNYAELLLKTYHCVRTYDAH